MEDKEDSPIKKAKLSDDEPEDQDIRMFAMFHGPSCPYLLLIISK